MNVILVDDHHRPRQEAISALESILDDPTIHEFDNPQDALTHYTTHGADLVVTDIVMPEINGLELAANVLEHEPVPVVLHTGSWSKDALYRLYLDSVDEALPLSVMTKPYNFPSETAYRSAFQQKIECARRKLNGDLDVSSLRDVAARLQEPDSLVGYVSVVYEELLHELQGIIARSPLREDLKATIAEQTFTEQEATHLFLHEARYTFQMLGLTLQAHQDIPEAAEAMSILKKMMDVKLYIEDQMTRYNPGMFDVVTHVKGLKSRERTPLPTNVPPIKLRNRLAILNAEGVPYTVVEPTEDANVDADYVFKPTGAVIARSMYVGEDGENPLAGFFASESTAQSHHLGEFVEQVRASGKKTLDKFCLYRGFEAPEEGMFVLVEPFQETPYIGAALQHPMDENLLMIEIAFRRDASTTVYMMYDVEKDEILVENDLELRAQQDYRELDRLKIARRAHAKFTEGLVRLGVDPSQDAYQMEFGFTAGTGRDILNFQIRKFKARQQPAEYQVDSPLHTTTVMGTAEEVELVVATTKDPEELSLIYQRAMEDGRKVAYVTKPLQNPNIPFYVGDMGLLIVGKSLAVQSHDYFNAMVAADNVLLLPHNSAVKELGLSQGDIITYTSNGIEASITKLDGNETLKYGIREMLNQQPNQPDNP